MNEMMKYEKPELEMIQFQTTDIVCASPDDSANDNIGSELPDW